MVPPPTSSGQDTAQTSAFRQWIKPSWRWLLGALCLALAWHALSRVAWDGVGELLARLGPAAIAILLGVNLLMMPLMTARWWLLLRTLGAPVGLFAACAYRLAVNAVNYLTPGPHFGGEPISVFLLHRRHAISLVRAAASVALDRLLELLASMAVLSFCLIHLIVVRSDTLAGSRGLPLIVGLLGMIMLMLAAFFSGRRPLSRFVYLFKTLDGRPVRWVPNGIGSLAEVIARAEAMAESLYRGHRAQFLIVNFFSLAHWIAVFVEFWLMSALLGLPLSFWQLTAVVAVARLSFFTPLPAGIGVLETALPWVTAAIGQGSALGASLCVIIRLRDLLFSLAGLALAMHYLVSIRK